MAMGVGSSSCGRSTAESRSDGPHYAPDFAMRTACFTPSGRSRMSIRPAHLCWTRRSRCSRLATAGSGYDEGVSSDPLVWKCGMRAFDCRERTLVMGILNVTPDSFSDGGRFLDPEVARSAVEVGASIVNDISAGDDPEMFALVRDTGVGMVLMHMKGEPKTMQDDPTYYDVVAEVRGFLGDRVEAATAAGIELDRLCVDPGIGFGKTLEHNLAILREIGAFHHLGVPLLVGPSRKRFIGTLTGT